MANDDYRGLNDRGLLTFAQAIIDKIKTVIPTKTSQLENDSGYKTTDTTYDIVSTTAAGLAPQRTGTTTKFLRDDGTWAAPTAEVDTLTSLEEVEASTDVSQPVGAGAVKELNRSLTSLGGFTPIIDETGQITGYTTTVGGADTVFPFSSGSGVKIQFDWTLNFSGYRGNGTYGRVSNSGTFIYDSASGEITGELPGFANGNPSDTSCVLYGYPYVSWLMCSVTFTSITIL